MDNIQDSSELRYYQAVCQIQDDFIKDKITKKECEQKLEIERLKQIIYLIGKNENTKKYRYRKTGEIYNGQIHINGECCTDGHGNEVVYE